MYMDKLCLIDIQLKNLYILKKLNQTKKNPNFSLQSFCTIKVEKVIKII